VRAAACCSPSSTACCSKRDGGVGGSDVRGVRDDNMLQGVCARRPWRARRERVLVAAGEHDAVVGELAARASPRDIWRACGGRGARRRALAAVVTAVVSGEVAVRASPRDIR
jgi:hypothetical protein